MWKLDRRRRTERSKKDKLAEWIKVVICPRRSSSEILLRRISWDSPASFPSSFSFHWCIFLSSRARAPHENLRGNKLEWEKCVSAALIHLHEMDFLGVRCFFPTMYKFRVYMKMLRSLFEQFHSPCRGHACWWENHERAFISGHGRNWTILMQL